VSTVYRPIKSELSHLTTSDLDKNALRIGVVY